MLQHYLCQSKQFVFCTEIIHLNAHKCPNIGFHRQYISLPLQPGQVVAVAVWWILCTHLYHCADCCRWHRGRLSSVLLPAAIVARSKSWVFSRGGRRHPTEDFQWRNNLSSFCVRIKTFKGWDTSLIFKILVTYQSLSFITGRKKILFNHWSIHI